jgi:hypothetical protein
MLRVAGQALVREAWIFILGRWSTSIAVKWPAISRANAFVGAFAESPARRILVSAAK